MKALLIALSILVSSSAFASLADGTSNFDFKIASGASGCVDLVELLASSDFPNVNGGMVDQINFYYEPTSDSTVVTENSPAFMSHLVTDNQGMSLDVSEFCGLAPGHYTFKYGMFGQDGALLEMQTDADVDPLSHSVDVQ